ncbi:MAG: AMP-binding protein, partial [Pseudomonadota bacterium]
KLNSARGAANRWGMVYEYGRFAGLQVLLQSVLSGAVLITPDLSDPLETQIAFLADQDCTHLSATPTLWRKIIMTRGHDTIPLQQVTMGGEIADDRILAAAKATYPQARVVHIFASTEAGVGFSVADGLAGFPEQFLTDPPAGVGLHIHDDQLYVRNTDVQAKYLNSDVSFADADGWVSTGDSVTRKDGRVYFLGRANGVINVGGNKAHPEEIERILRDHDAVAAVRIYAKSNPFTGALVAADVVLRDPNADQKEARTAILDYAKTRLIKHEVPQLLKFVDGFDTNAAGKMIRKR